MRILKNHNQIIFKVCLALLVISLVILARELVYHDTGLMLAWGALIFLIVDLFFVAWFVGYDSAMAKTEEKPDHGSDKTGETAPESGIDLLSWQPGSDLTCKTIQLHYLLHLVNPEMSLESKVAFGLKQLPELMPDKIFTFFSFEEGQLQYVSGTRLNSRSQSERIFNGDSIIEELKRKIRSCLDIRSVRQSGNFVSSMAFSQHGKIEQGILLPVSFCGRLHGTLAVISTGNDLFTADQKYLLKHFCEGMALLLENHKIFSSQSAAKFTAAENELTASLLTTQLPAATPAIKGWEIAQVARYSSERTGDFHDYINMSGNRLMIVIGRCSGKGLSTAVFFTRFKAMVSCLIEQCQSPAELLNRLSVNMVTDTMQELFATVAAVQIRGSDRTVTLALAGHPAPFINRTRSGFVELPQLDSGVPLGLFNHGVEPYKNQTIQLLPGDGILLYTEGVTEYSSGSHERIGNEELKLLLDRLPEQSANEMLENLAQEIVPVRDGFSPIEDHTLIYAKTE